MQLRPYPFFFVIYLLDFVVVLGLDVFLLAAPCTLSLGLTLLLVLKVLLELSDLGDQLRLILVVLLRVLLHGHTLLLDVDLQLDSFTLRGGEVGSRVFYVLNVVVDIRALPIEGCDRGLQSLDLDLLLGDLHGHLVLLVVEHVLVVECGCAWGGVDGHLRFLWALGWGGGGCGSA